MPSQDVTSEPSVRQTLAVHEAGHAVMAWVLGVTVTRIEIRGDSGHSWDSPPAHWSPAGPGARRLRLISAAGPAAETLAFGAPPQAYQAVAWRTDLDALPTEPAAYARTMRAAMRLIRRYWPAVLALAQHLQTRGHASASDILRIVSEATPAAQVRRTWAHTRG